MIDITIPPAMRLAVGLFMTALADFSRLSPEDQALYARSAGLDSREMVEAFRQLGAYFSRAATIAEGNQIDRQRQPGVLQ